MHWGTSYTHYLTVPIRLLPELFASHDPYGYAAIINPMAYPLTAVIVTLPLAPGLRTVLDLPVLHYSPPYLSVHAVH